MKKIFAAMIALAMVLSLSVAAFAAEGSNTGNKPGESQSIDVTAKTETSSSTETVYSVDITWESMTFTYVESETKVWDSATHTYSTTTTSGWDKTEAKITVTNHSNAAVTATVTYAASDESSGITGTITNGTDTLDAGVENKPNEADSMVATLTISGTPTDSVDADGVVVGQITITIGN